MPQPMPRVLFAFVLILGLAMTACLSAAAAAPSGRAPGDVTAAVAAMGVEVNHPPVAVPDFYDVLMNGGIARSRGGGGILDNDFDPDPDDIFLAFFVSGVSHGTLVLQADGGFTYNPFADFFGTDSFTYQAADIAASTSAITTVTFTVIGAVSLPPSASLSPVESPSLSTSLPGSPSTSVSSSPSTSPPTSAPASASASASDAPSPSPSRSPSPLASPSASVGPSAPAGTGVADVITVQAYLVVDDARAGTVEYSGDVVSAEAIDTPLTTPAPGYGFASIDSTTGISLEQAVTDASGVVVLDGEVGAPLYVMAQDDPNGSRDYTLTEGETLLVRAVIYVHSSTPSPAPSTAPSAQGPAPSVTGGDGMTAPSVAGTTPSGSTALPNTGSGAVRGGTSPWVSLLLTLFAVAVVAAATAGLIRGRREG